MLGRRVTITQISPDRFRVCHAGMCLYASEPYTALTYATYMGYSPNNQATPLQHLHETAPKTPVP